MTTKLLIHSIKHGYCMIPDGNLHCITSIPIFLSFHLDHHLMRNGVVVLKASRQSYAKFIQGIIYPCLWFQFRRANQYPHQSIEPICMPYLLLPLIFPVDISSINNFVLLTKNEQNNTYQRICNMSMFCIWHVFTQTCCPIQKPQY